MFLSTLISCDVCTSRFIFILNHYYFLSKIYNSLAFDLFLPHTEILCVCAMLHLRYIIIWKKKNNRMKMHNTIPISLRNHSVYIYF